MSNIEIIKTAIKERIVIQFNYQGKLRIVEPFLLGYLTETGNLSLSAYKIGGQSTSNSKNPWRTYTVNEITNLKLTDKSAANHRPDYNKNDKRMSRIICAF